MILSVFNNFLSEEFLFHGVLLPKMKGSIFGRSRDWVANGIVFGLYHLRPYPSGHTRQYRVFELV